MNFFVYLQPKRNKSFDKSDIHINFYNEFYVFNISKTLKEEFHDLYITKIDDFNTELTAINLQENKLDTENQLFFHVYFKELSMGGFINDELEYQFLPKLTEDDFQLFSELNFYKGIDANFTLNPENAREKFEEFLSIPKKAVKRKSLPI